MSSISFPRPWYFLWYTLWQFLFLVQSCQNTCTIVTNDDSHLPRLVHPTYMTRDLSSHNCVLLRNHSWGNDATIYLNIPNHSWRNDYNWGYTENTLSTLYTTLISLYWTEDLPSTEQPPEERYRSNTCLLLRSSIYIRFLHGNIRQKPTKRLRTNIIITYLIIVKFTQTKTLFYTDLLLRSSWLTYSSKSRL